MAPWKVVARSFRPAPRIPGIASDAPPPPRSRDTHSREDLGSPAPAHRAPGAGGDHIRGTQTPCEQACAAPTVSASSPLRPVRADTPGTPATTESQSILCASTAECTQKSHLTESSTFEGFPEFLRRALFSSYRDAMSYGYYLNGEFDFYGPGTSIGSGNDRADFLMGLPDDLQQYPNAPTNIRSHSFGGYVQDAWKLSRRFTLNYGLRYEY